MAGSLWRRIAFLTMTLQKKGCTRDRRQGSFPRMQTAPTYLRSSQETQRYRFVLALFLFSLFSWLLIGGVLALAKVWKEAIEANKLGTGELACASLKHPDNVHLCSIRLLTSLVSSFLLPRRKGHFKVHRSTCSQLVRDFFFFPCSLDD
jgi:hypothetical protein